jgi:hypothetical protein
MASVRREYYDKILKRLFKGADSLDNESYWQFSYGFSERKAECGQILADEMVAFNHCIVLLEGTCKVYKHKNLVQPFRIWKSGLEPTLQETYFQELIDFEQNILALTREKVQLATIGSGEVIAGETLLVENWNPLPEHKPMPKGQSKALDFSDYRADSVSLFTVEVESPTVEYLLISKTILKKFFKDEIKNSFIERWFINLRQKVKIMSTNVMFCVNTRPDDFGDRNGNNITKNETVRNKIYRDDCQKLENLKALTGIKKLNPRHKFGDMWELEKKLLKPTSLKTNMDMSVWKELNDARTFMRNNYESPSPVKVSQRLVTKVKIPMNKFCQNLERLSTNMENTSAAARRFEFRRKNLAITFPESNESQNLLKIKSMTSNTDLILTSRTRDVTLIRPSELSARSDNPGSKPVTEKLAGFIKHVRGVSLGCDNEGSLWSTSYEGNCGATIFTARSRQNRDTSNIQERILRTAVDPSPRKSDACGRAWRKILHNRSSRQSQKRKLGEQSVFSQQQSPVKARLKIDKLMSFKKAGKDPAILFDEPMVYLSSANIIP